MYTSGDLAIINTHDSQDNSKIEEIVKHEKDNKLGKRIPQCYKCSVHGIKTPVKGHKKNCPNKNCGCRLCKLAVKRKKLNLAKKLIEKKQKDGLAHNQSIEDNSESGDIEKCEQNNNSGKRSPKCAKCKNHKKIVPVRGHKRKCPHKNCSCDLCKLTDEIRENMKENIKEKRNQIQDMAEDSYVAPDPVFEKLGTDESSSETDRESGYRTEESEKSNSNEHNSDEMSSNGKQNLNFYYSETPFNPQMAHQMNPQCIPALMSDPLYFDMFRVMLQQLNDRNVCNPSEEQIWRPWIGGHRLAAL